MDLLTEAITEAEGLEGRLNQYDDLLEHIRDSMEKMEGKTESLETVNENNGYVCVYNSNNLFQYIFIQSDIFMYTQVAVWGAG